MNRGFYNRLVSLFVFLSTFLWIASFCACSNKVLDVEAEGQAELADDDLSLSVKNSLVSEGSSKSAYPSSFKPNDKEYPYAGVPRVVIETEYRQVINDRETEIPAKLQIWGENESESEIMDLTIRGRGYSSWDMKKKGYKIKFQKKQRMFGLSRDKEWNLIANYADKSLLRNYITYKLSEWLEMPYSVKSVFVELYINSVYYGVYQFTENVKVSDERVCLPKDGSSFLFEKEPDANDGSLYIRTKYGTEYKIRYPKEPVKSNLDSLINYIGKVEDYLRRDEDGKDSLDYYLNVESFVPFYWIQEFTKNNDAAASRSLFYTWSLGGVINFGPVWDFDVAYGNKPQESMQNAEDWYIRPRGWYKYIFKEETVRQKVLKFWKKKRNVFVHVNDSIDCYAKQLSMATENEFKRWNIEQQSVYANQNLVFKEYNEAVNALKLWINKRIEWIDDNFEK